jgi:hypothetical protein
MLNCAFLRSCSGFKNLCAHPLQFPLQFGEITHHPIAVASKHGTPTH